MIKADVALIGGTGIGDRLAEWPGESVTVESAYGVIQGRLVVKGGLRILAMQRHSTGHKTPPHKVNYRAMAAGLREAGVRACVSSAAVGSLHVDWTPGTLAVCTDMVDLTFRRLTMFDETVQHTDMSTPFPLSSIMGQVASTAKQQAVYFGLDGPRYESPAEVRMLQKLGGDVVGMTASTEAILMREAGVPYGCLAVVTNLGCGLTSGSLAHGEVIDVMQTHGAAVLDILWETLQRTVA